MAPAITRNMARILRGVSFSPKKITAMSMAKMTDVSLRAATSAIGAMVIAQMAMPYEIGRAHV